MRRHHGEHLGGDNDPEESADRVVDREPHRAAPGERKVEMFSAAVLEMIGVRIGSHQWGYFSPWGRAKVVVQKPKLPLPSGCVTTRVFERRVRVLAYQLTVIALTRPTT